jgi:hypothetical protein
VGSNVLRASVLAASTAFIMACGIAVEGIAPLGDDGGVTIGEAGMLSGDGAGSVVPDPSDATAGSADGGTGNGDGAGDDAVVDAGADGVTDPDATSCGAACADAGVQDGAAESGVAEGGVAEGGTDEGVPEGGIDGAAPEGGTPDGGPDGSTADAGSDAASCSVSCDTTTGSPTCHGNTCSYACTQGLADCNAATAPDTDGCESSLSSTASCAACGNACDTSHSTGATCNGRSCLYAGCATGYVNCASSPPDANGCETPLASTSNCAACGNACDTSTGTPSCSGTTCSYVCRAGRGDCNANTAPDLDGCETSVTTPSNCGRCGTVCSGACVTHSDGLGASYWSCQPTSTYDQAQAMDACVQSNHGACADVTTSCGDAGSNSAVCACPTGFFGAQYCWVYSGPNKGRAFVGLSVFTCSACPAGGTVAWN